MGFGTMVYFKFFVSIIFIIGGFIIYLSYKRLIVLHEITKVVSSSNREKIEQRLSIHRKLMLFFALGYICMAYLSFFRTQYIQESLVAVIFLLSAVFIYVGVIFQSFMGEELLKTLRGILPICMSCKKVRTENAENTDKIWTSIEEYISHQTEVEISHGLCPDCYNELRSGITNPNIE